MRWILTVCIVGCAAACGGSEPEPEHAAPLDEPVAEVLQESEAEHAPVAPVASGEHVEEPPEDVTDEAQVEVSVASTAEAAAEPGEAQSGKAKPGEAKPAEATSAEAKPSEAPVIEFAVQLLEPGSGRAAALGDSLLLDYEAFAGEATLPFDSTRKSGVALAVVLGAERPKLIAGLTRGLVGLRAGAHARIEIPPELAWGVKGCESIGVPADTRVVYDVRVLAVGAEHQR